MVVKRKFDAPAERVFDAWLDPAAAGRWLFATPGGKMLRVEIDARVGGRFTLTEQRGDLAVEHVGKYVEISRPRRLVFEFSVPQFSPAATLVAVEIIAQGAACELTLTHTGVLPEWADRTAEGWTKLLGGLAEVLDRPAAFVLSRTFKAPRDLVWKAWTERERLMQWFGPKGSSMPTAKMDFRPGGVFHYSMRNCAPGHGETLLWGKWIFREIKMPERIVLIHHFSDENGGVTRHPFHPSWPLQMLSTTTFLESHGETTVTVQWAPLDATAEERQTFDRGRDGMLMGWSGTFDQLEAYLNANR